LIVQENIFDEEESLTLHNASFDKELKKLVFQHVNSRGKRVKDSTMDLRGVPTSKLSKIHMVTGNSLDISIDDMEAENERLKNKVRELENALMPPPIFAKPLAFVQPGMNPDDLPESSSKWRGTPSLLVAVRKFVEENIKKRMSLVLEAWDISNNIMTFGSRLHSFKEYLQVDYENDEGFYKNELTTFILKIMNMTELKIKEENFPSQARVKQLKACWIKKIKTLKELLEECSEVLSKREILYQKLMEIDLAGNTEKYKILS
jgi:hypothetical protein